jgi:saccharopine dehydrogenase-like NADP-dependent oxidoreductase
LNGRILVAGGYGEVGRRLAAQLARGFPDRVVVAGRSLERARETAQALGHGAAARALDVNDAASVGRALQEVAVVVACVQQSPACVLLRAAVAGGLAYTDLTASLIWRPALALRAEAEARGARVVLGAGLVPGVSSVLARAAADALGPLASVETALLLGVGDAFGPDSLEYLLHELSEPLVVTEAGRERLVACFSEPRAVDFPPPVGRRIARRAPFADQFFFPRSLGVATAATRLALDPPWLGTLIAALLRSGGGRLLRRRFFRSAVHALVRRAHGRRRGSDRWALVVNARGQGGEARYSLLGRRQAEATASAAALLVGMLGDGTLARPGVWFSEQVIEPERFLAGLRASGLDVHAAVQAAWSSAGPSACGTSVQRRV